MNDLKEGFNRGVSNEHHHKNKTHISSSGLKLLLKSPKSFYEEYVLGKEKEWGNMDALNIGSYVHSLILEPEKTDEEFIIYSGTRRGKEWEAFSKENEDKIILTTSQSIACKNWVDTFNKTTVLLGAQDNTKEVPLSSFFDEGEAEVTVCTELEGVEVKVRPDYWKEGTFNGEPFHSIQDIKTSGQYVTSKADVERICSQWDYDLSAALYVDVMQKVTSTPHDFFFMFISKKDGQCAMYKASKQMLEEGRKKYVKALRYLKRARETGIYWENKIEEIDSI